MRKLLGIVFGLSIMLVGACVDRTSILGDSNMNGIGWGPWDDYTGCSCEYCGV